MPRRTLAVSVTTAMVLLGSLLSFGMEPLVGRLVVPFYGGAVHVWTTSMMTFQGLLLAGYAYAHLLAPRLGAWHLAVLLLPFAQWPLAFSSPVAPEAPIATLVGALLASVSLPFAVLTTTAVVAQSWWSRSALVSREEPWWLYGASNLGSLSALLGYPLLVEPFVGLAAQSRGWSLFYIGYVALAAAAWSLLRPAAPSAPGARSAGASAEAAGVEGARRWRWLALSAAPSMLLLGLTNEIAHEVGSFPLVWVVPLALYLGSFLWAFRDAESAAVKASRWWILLVAAQMVAFAGYRGTASVLVLVASLVPFTLLCVACHRLLYELRPPVERLTAFYLWVALGGWIGGTVVTLGAPTLLTGLFESFVASAAVALALGWAAPLAADARWAPWGGDLALRNRYAAYGGVLLAMALVDRSGFVHGTVLERYRNFYGCYRVEDLDADADEGVPAYRRMVHGSTLHGSERKDGDGFSRAYYYPGSPLSDVVAARPSGPARVAVIGLGAGGMARMIDADDTMVFYEIDPDIERLARHWFSFMDGAASPVTVRTGDARLSLLQEARSGEAAWDVLVIDAFSGDGIPVHLATREAWQVYMSRLAGDGILAMHISNRYYDLKPVLARLAADAGLEGLFAEGSGAIDSRPELVKGLDLPSHVVAFARDPARLATLRARGWVPLAEAAGPLPAEPWTDDFGSVLAALRR